MIYVDRNTVPTPNIFNTDKVEIALEELEYYYDDIFDVRDENINKSDFSISYEFFRDPEVTVFLRMLFNDKCAYCETNSAAFKQEDFKEEGINYLATYMDIDLFRPRNRAINLDNAIHLEYYWWLSYDWNNFYLCCPTCYNNKGTKFPVAGERIKPFEDITKEKPLLLDPCNPKLEADIAKHLLFDKNGTVQGVSKEGEITIHVFGLNRPQLIKDRKKSIAHYLQLIKKLGAAKYAGKKQTIKKLEETIATYLAKDFTAAKHQVLDQLTNQTTSYPKRGLVELADEEIKLVEEITNKQIRKIQLVNFKNIEKLEIVVQNKVEEEEAWLVLLGENGAGKSSILQAIAIALMGNDRLNALNLDASSFLNFHQKSKVGFVRLIFENGDEIKVSFSKNSKQFKAKLKRKKQHIDLKQTYDIFCGFGATRLFSKKKIITPNNDEIEGLFDPYILPEDYANWAASLYYNNQRDVFTEIVIALKKILQLDEYTKISSKELENKRYDLFLENTQTNLSISLRRLSSGYQSVLFLFLGIVKSSFTKWKSPFLIDGIVLIDEIGIHLHPEWKMRIVRQLRMIFKRATFIISTHEPLCLRGVKKGEVILLERNEYGTIKSVIDLPSPNTMRIGQLLTSVFGLRTSLDPILSDIYDEYLLLKQHPDKNELESARFETLKAQLKEYMDENEELNMLLGSDIYANIYYRKIEEKYQDYKKHIKPLRTYKESTRKAFKDLWDKN